VNSGEENNMGLRLREGHESNNADTTIVDTFARFALVDKSLFQNSIIQQLIRGPHYSPICISQFTVLLYAF